MKLIMLILTAHFFTFCLYGNERIDSIKNELTNLSGEEKLESLLRITSYYDIQQYDSTLKYNSIYTDYAAKTNNLKHLARGYSSNAYFNIAIGNHSDARNTLDTAIQLYFEIEDSLGAAFCYSQIAHVFEIQGKTDSTYYYYTYALKILDIDNLETYLKNYNEDDKIHKKRLGIFGIILTDMGLFYLSMNDYEHALASFEKTLEIGEIMQHNRRKASSYSNIGMIFSQQGDTQKALENYKKAILFAEKAGDLVYQMRIINNTGVIYEETVDDPNEALNYFKKAVELANQVSDNKAYLIYQFNVARIMSKLGNSSEALILLDSLSDMVTEYGDLVIKQRYYRVLSDIYEREKDFKNAFENIKLFYVYKDSIFNEENIKQMSELKAEFESERKDYQIELLTKEKAMLNNQIFFTLGLFFLIVILVILILSRYRVKMKAYKQIEAMNNQLKKSESELLELNATKDKFFTIIAHDLKGPIGTYKNVLEFIDSKYEELSKNDIREFLDEIKKSSDSLFMLLQDLLKWANSQTGKIQITPVNIALKELFYNNISILSISANKKKIQLKSELADDIEVIADVPMTTTVLRNLISNAIKFTKEGGSIVLNARKSDNMALISVEDDGVGIPLEDVNRLFDITCNLTSKGTSGEKGSGLGLILCKEFVEKNGGEIWVESEKGRGSTFFFTLPLLNDINKLHNPKD